MNDTPTPRTNALLGKILYDCGVLDEDTAPEEWVQLARQLESERDEMKEQCDLLTEQLDFQRNLSREYVDLNTGWRNKWECAVELAALASVERDEARDHIEHMKKYCMVQVGALQKQTCARMLAESQRDTLAEALRNIRDGYGGQAAAPDCCEDCDFLIPIDEALATLNRTEP